MPRIESPDTIRRWVSSDSNKHEWIISYLLRSTELKMAWSRDQEDQDGREPPIDWELFVQSKIDRTQGGITVTLHWLYKRYREGIIEYSRMKSAWSQKKYRSRLKFSDKKVYNFVMSSQIKKDLDYIAKINQQPLNQTIERLISEEASQLRSRNDRRSKQLKELAVEPIIETHQAHQASYPKPTMELPYQVKNNFYMKRIRQDQERKAAKEKQQRALAPTLSRLGRKKGCALKKKED